MEIKRDAYLNEIIQYKWDGQIKVITGIRRCGKSFLLRTLYRNYLLENGVAEKRIISIELDQVRDIKYRNPLGLTSFVRGYVEGKQEQYYLFIDEIQMSDEVNNPYNPDGKKITFYDALNDLRELDNLDIYVTGSNSKMLSSDILTEFRGRGDEIRVNPLSFEEFYHAYEGDKRDAWQEYYTYGGLPLVMMKKSHEEKAKYLQSLFDKIYLGDIIERNKILHDKSVLDDILNIISSSVGSLTNAGKIARTFRSERQVNISDETVSRYLEFFVDAFMIYKADRYDVKGRKYIGSPLKYYFSDVGLRNARLNFRQQEENHIMENIIYNELLCREFNVDVGVVEYCYKDEQKKSKRTQLEIDFVANKGSRRYYIQSALTVADEEKRAQEVNSLNRVGDSFKKIVVVKDNIIPWHDENGILYVGIEKFLLNETAMEL